MDRNQNFHLPLPDSVYRRLRKEAEHRGIPATALAREAVEAWLDQIPGSCICRSEAGPR